MKSFVGRQRELGLLEHELRRVRRSDASGQCLLVRGRRRVGKSRLIEEFCDTAEVPSLFFTASQQGDRELKLFVEEIERSSLPGKHLAQGMNPDSWDSALRLLATVLDGGSKPVVVVFDEFPYLVAGDPTLEATFQKQWDRLLSKRSVLLILVGSDLAMMEALNTHGRAFFQRGSELVVPPLSPLETGEITGLSSSSSILDAYLLTGGLPLICADWTRGRSMWTFLSESLARPTSPLIVSAERVLAAEFPTESQAKQILYGIGNGEVSFTKIARAAGGVSASSLSRSLDFLAAKGIVSKDLPLATVPSKEARYRIADPYLRFWMRFIGPFLAEIERSRSDRVVERIKADWTTWRGRAIEPVVREALTRMSGTGSIPAANVVGGFWTRSNTPEVDIVGADRSPVAKSIAYAGTIKWHDASPLNQSDLNQLAADITKIPGADSSTPLVAVSRSGHTARGSINIGPDDILAAW
jgi:uncharacterized protein